MPDALPTIGAHVGVMDEIDLIAACIGHLRQIGVSQIVVHDMYSTDGTREWLTQATEGHADLAVVSYPPGTTEDLLIAFFAETVRGFHTDWVVMLDADEFPLPRSGDLRQDMAVARGDEVSLRRHNVALGSEGALLPLPVSTEDYADIPLYVRMESRFQWALAENPADYWLRGVPNPKVAVRPTLLQGFGPGMHATRAPGAAQATPQVLPGIVVAHLPLTTYKRFAHKIDNVRALFAEQVTWPAGFGWHWRRWVELAERGELRAEYDRSICSPAELARLHLEGAVRSAAEVLSGQPSGFVPSDADRARTPV